MVFFGNSLSSVTLLEDLKDHVLACGTIRGNRKNLPSLAADKDCKERGDFDYSYRAEEISVYKWKGPILFISDYLGCKTTSVTRW